MRVDFTNTEASQDRAPNMTLGRRSIRRIHERRFRKKDIYYSGLKHLVPAVGDAMRDGVAAVLATTLDTTFGIDLTGTTRGRYLPAPAQRVRSSVG